MIVSPCPRCGKPRRIPTSFDGWVICDACGDRRAPDAQLAAELAARHRAQQNVPLLERQFQKSEDWALDASIRATRTRRLFIVTALVLGTAFAFGLLILGGFLDAANNLESHRNDGWVIAAALLTPLPLQLTSGYWLLRRRRSIADAVAVALFARPPLLPGGAYTCRFCSAPLDAGRTERGAIRCAYCATDNLFDAATSARLAMLEQRAYDKSMSAAPVLRRHRTVEIFERVVLVAPPILLVGGFVGSLLAYASLGKLRAARLMEPHPLDPQKAWVFAASPNRPPLRYKGNVVLAATRSKDDTREAFPVNPTWMVGKKVDSYDDYRVEGVYRNPYGYERATIVHVPSGRRESRHLSEVHVLVDAAPPPP